jgi:hypothetical protein
LAESTSLEHLSRLVVVKPRDHLSRLAAENHQEHLSQLAGVGLKKGSLFAFVLLSDGPEE